MTHIQPSELKRMTISEMLGLFEYLDDKRKVQEKMNREMKRNKWH